MILKRSLSAFLAASIAFPATLPSVAFAQAAPAAKGADTIDLIIRAMAAKTSAEAKTYLSKAETQVATEQLPADSIANITQMMAQVRAKISSSKYDAKISIALTPDGKATDPTAALAKLLQDNPTIHNLLGEVATGRLERDAQPANLEALVKAATGQKLADVDNAHAQTEGVLADVGAFITQLRAKGAIKDPAPENKALKETHESVPLDVLADQIIEKHASKAVVAAALKQVMVFRGTSKLGSLGGVTVEAMANFAVKANLIIQLADLYNMNLSESNEDVAILTLLPFSKLLIYGARQTVVVKQTVDRVAELYTEAKANPNPTVMDKFYAGVFASSLMRALALKAGLGKRLQAARSAIQDEGKPKVAAASVEPAPASALEKSFAKIEDAAATAEVAVAEAGTTVEKVAKSPLTVKAMAGWFVANIAYSYGETYATGKVAKWWFARSKQKARDIETSDFHFFLMRTDRSIGLFKLLIAMANSNPSLPNLVDVKKQAADARVSFIMNVAHSVRICSPDEAAQFHKLQAQGGSLQGRAKNLFDADYRLLRFECEHKLGFGRYEQIVKEFATFNAIPEWQIAQLRLASYTQRMQMGELLMQLMFLNGEPNDNQILLFNTTMTKILGLTRIDDANYFSRFYGFIRERGGMDENSSAITGFVISADPHTDPYSLSANYTVPGGPDMPAPPPAVSADAK